MGSSIIFKTLKLQTRISYYSSFLIFLIVTLAGLLFYITISDALQTQIGNRALYLAETTASRGDVIEAFHTDNPSESLQKISNDIMVAAKATYVVIGDKNGIRYTHPLADRIGKSMVGDDNDRALINGESYISIADGSMGQSIRGKAPIFDTNGAILGVVSIGYLTSELDNLYFLYLDNIFYTIIIALTIGIIGSIILSRNIKKQIFNLEPNEIANLLTEKNTLIESVREAIITINDKGKITTLNNAAANILNLPDSASIIGHNIKQHIPNTHLLNVLMNGEKQLDKLMIINGDEIIVNRVPMRVNGKIVGAVASFRLQSEIEQMAIELSQVKQYTEALRAQTHEFNNILYTISGLIQLNASDEALTIIHNEVQGHSSLTQFITNRVKDPFLNGLIIGFFNRARELKIQLIFDEDSYLETFPENIEKGLIISIMGNLLTNAFEEVERNKEQQPIVRLFIFDNGEEIIFEVEDSGNGIAQEKLDVLFSENISTKDRKHRGYGLKKVISSIHDLNGTLALGEGDLGGALFIISISKRGTINND
ncbi:MULTISPECIES: ATP-binding protein [Lysinibacillus]|uniref:histidine kinase n=3 Tax=Lysinibacillus TaxID=400634 RepID=W7RSP5_LYSSH|nr:MULTISPECIES: sensor histidine kinase [Lysinibacillus]EWH34452.1 sensor histidine kinase [Lysinibacillus sphaericus CBAM5]MCS1398468.1 sensor histidine kinase [Lysinibacillus sp. PB211]MDR0158497.1 sensor histidine kinase [Lysinibacillus sphaericus]MEB7452093.1 sensor histidine kinase [Lysinibacillus sphaericus]